MRYLLILILLVPNMAHACESYEECMTLSDHCITNHVWTREGMMIPNCTEQDKQNYYQKSIAFKLDEISQKLDRNAGPFNAMIDKAIRKENK